MTGSDLVEFSNNAAFWPLHRSFRRAMRERASRVGAVEVLTAEANSRLGRSAGPPEPGSSKPPQTPAGPKKIIGAATAAEVSATSQFESFAVVGEMLRMSPENVNTRLARAKQRLRAAYEQRLPNRGEAPTFP